MPRSGHSVLDGHRSHFWLIAVLALTAALAATAANATTITWNNSAGGAWSNAANWTPNEVPDAAGETAVLPALSGAYQVTLDMSPACDGLDIAAGNPTLDVSGQSLSGITLVTNHGSIANFAGTLDTDRLRNEAGGVITVGGAVNVTPILWNDGSIVLGLGTSISAPGALELQGSGEIAVDGELSADKLTIGSDVTVRGGGSVLTRITYNNGLILADAENGTLLHPGFTYNAGTLRMSNGAMLHVRSGGVQNSGIIENGTGGGRLRIGWYDESMGTLFTLPGGRIIASEGDLQIHCGMLVRATLERAGETGAVRIVVATVENLVVAEGAELVVENLMSVLTDQSTLTNNGTIRVPGVIQFGGINDGDSHALTGSGKVILEGGDLGMPEGLRGTLVNQQLIEGCGTIYPPFTNEGTVNLDCSSGGEAVVVAPFINKRVLRISHGAVTLKGPATILNTGTIACDGGRIKLDGGVTVDNRAGTLLSNRGMVDLGGAGGGTVWGGRLASQGDGLFGVGKVATLKDVTIGPSATVIAYGYTTLNAAGGRLANEGTLKVMNRATLAVPATTEYVQTGGLTSIEKGTITAARELRIEGGTLRGGGTIQGSVLNGATLIPDPAMGALLISGNYRQLPSATFNAMLGGTSPTQNSRLNVTGNASLDGWLTTSTLGSFHPAAGTSFEVLSYAAVSGRFVQFRASTPDGSIDVSPIYGASSFALQFRPQVSVGDGSRPASLAFYGQRSRQGASFVLELPQAAVVKGRVYDAAGREVARLADGLRDAGVHTFAFGGGGASLSSGVYFARMVVTHDGASEVKTARVTLLQ